MTDSVRTPEDALANLPDFWELKRTRTSGPDLDSIPADALELTGLPAVEVHLSDVDTREEWRRTSVLEGLCLATIAGRGVDGYRLALEPGDCR